MTKDIKKKTFSLTWRRAGQSTDWLWSWVVLVEVLCMSNLDLDKLPAVLYICHTKHLFCPYTNHPEREQKEEIFCYRRSFSTPSKRTKNKKHN